MVDVPAAADLKARYPAFASVADATVTYVLEEASAQVDDNWLAQDIAPAIMAYAAHLLAVEGAGVTVTIGTGDSVQVAGPVDAVQVGDVRTSFAAGVTRAKMVMKGDETGLRETAFGRRFLELRRRNAAAAIVLDA